MRSMIGSTGVGAILVIAGGAQAGVTRVYAILALRGINLTDG